MEVAVLDIGSKNISVLIGERGINNTLNISGRGECEYSGYVDGRFLEPNKLSQVFGVALKMAEINSKSKVRRLNIGVPSEFCYTVVQDVELPLGRRRKVSQSDISELHNLGVSKLPSGSYRIINIQPIAYVLDGTNRTLSPEDTVASKIAGRISFTSCSLSFVQQLENIVEALGVGEFDLCSSLLAEGLFLFEETRRDQGVILVDCGYLSTSVAVIKGDGLLAHSSFSVGGAHISADINMYLQVPFVIAEKLKQIVKLPLEVGSEDNYELEVGIDKLKYNAQIVNAIVAERIKAIGKTINDALIASNSPKYSVYLTGGGLSYMRGARDILAKTINRSIDIIAPTLPEFNRPNLSSNIGLLDMVINAQEEPLSQQSNRKGILGWFLGK